MIWRSRLKFLAVILAVLLPMTILAQGPVLYRSLVIGSAGEDVRALQQWLNANGFIVSIFGPGSPGSETTYYGPLTAAAFARYQATLYTAPTNFNLPANPVAGLPAGCTSTAGFSPLTGTKCDSFMTNQTPAQRQTIVPPADSSGNALYSALTAVLSNLQSSSGGSSAGNNKPFGGLSVMVVDCTECSDNYYIRINSVKSDLPSELIYVPGESILYEFMQITSPGKQLLGTWDGTDQCELEVCDGECCTVFTGKKIKMVGTSY